MISSIVSIIDELKAERTAGDEMATDLIARIDAHIRDLETLKAWVQDSATARAMAITGMLGGEPEAPEALNEATGTAQELAAIDAVTDPKYINKQADHQAEEPVA